MENKKAYFTIITIIIVVIGLFFLTLRFSQNLKNISSSQGEAKKEKIKIANIGEHSIFNLIAADQGFFEANGLDAEIKEYPSGPPAVSDLLAGKADFAIAADFVGVTTISNNNDIRILAEVSKHDIFKIVSRVDKGISKPSDLKGKRRSAIGG